MRPCLSLVALALGALAATALGPPAAAGGRIVVVDTQVSIETISTEGPLRPGEAVSFRVSVTSEGPAVVRKGELRVAALVDSIEQPTVQGKQGLRCLTAPNVNRKVDADWVVLCANTRVFRDGDSLSVLLRIIARGSKLSVLAGAAAADKASSGLTVKSKRDRTSIVVATPSFRITSVSLPSSIVSNGPKGDLTVYWEGEPTFPVTLFYAPDTCPAGVNCTTPTTTFQTAEHPFVFVGAVWCAGSSTSSIFFDYSVYLQDATGKRTSRKNADFTCLPA